MQLPLVEVPGNDLFFHSEPILMLQFVQDMQCVENCDDPDPKRHVLYEQPVWQTLQMFRMWPYISSPHSLFGSAYTHTFDFSSQLEKCSVCPFSTFLPMSDVCFTGTRVGQALSQFCTALYRRAGVNRPFVSPTNRPTASLNPKSFHQRG